MDTPAFDSGERLIHDLDQVELEMQMEELRRTHDELEASRDRYRDLFEFAPVGCLTLDSAGVVTEVNRTAESLFGVERTRILGRPLVQFVLPHDGSILHHHLRAVRESGGRQVCEARVLRADGGLADVLVDSLPERGVSGGIRTALVDATGRRGNATLDGRNERSRLFRQEERDALRHETALALARDHAVFEQIVETLAGPIIVVGMDGRILRVNEAACRLAVRPAEELQGEEWLLSFVPEEFRNLMNDAFARVLVGATAERLTAHLTLRSGDVRTMEWTLAPLDTDAGRPIGVSVVGQDVTERRSLEEQIRQVRKMEAVGTLASGVAHDFNNVLMGIIGCADMALNRLRHDEPARRYVDQLKATALGGAAVVDRLMAFARRRRTDRKVIDMNSLISRMDTMLRHLLGEDVELRTLLAASNAAVSCQPDEIEQLVMNLCVNARHAMPRGGSLTLSTREGTLPDGVEPGSGGDRCVIIDVIDTGVGMDERTRMRIFEPFFTTKPAGEGTGLGLSTVQATVQEHGGHIEVESALGVGSRFSISLPQSAEAPTRASVAPDGPLGTQPGGETVLVVEDEPLVRLTVCHYLECHGYRVLEAGSETEVARLLEGYTGPIDVLLTDAVLPGRSGLETAQSVCAARSDVRVVYMSAHSAETLLSEGRIPPGARSLQKPFTESALVTAIRKALSDVIIPPSDLLGSVSMPRLRVGRPRLLLVEDQDAARMASSELLVELGYDVIAVSTGAAALQVCHDQGDSIDVVVTDVGLPDLNGVEVARRIRDMCREIGIVFLSGRSGDDVDLSGLLGQRGTAFLQKPIEIGRLARTIDRVLDCAVVPLRTA